MRKNLLVYWLAAAIFVFAFSLFVGLSGARAAEEPTIVSQTFLPSSNVFGKAAYWAKWRASDARRALIFSKEKKADYEAKRSERKFSEALELINDGKLDLAKSAISDYKTEVTECKKNWGTAAAAANKGNFSAGTLERIESTDSIFTKELAVVQQEEVEDSGDANQLISTEVKNVVQDAVDTSADLKGESPVPAELKTYLSDLKKLGIITDAQYEGFLAEATSRVQARNKIEELITSGVLPSDSTAMMDAAKVESYFPAIASNYKVYAAAQTFKTSAVSGVIAPPTEEEAKKIAELQEKMAADPSVINSSEYAAVRKFVMSQVYSAYLTKTIAQEIKEAKLELFKSEVKDFLQNIKNNIQIGSDVSDVAIKDNKFIIPENLDDITSVLAGLTQISSKLQNMVQADFAQKAKEFASSMKQSGSGSVNEDEFRKKFFNNTGIDVNYMPASWSYDDMMTRTKQTVVPEALGMTRSGAAAGENAGATMKGFFETVDKFKSDDFKYINQQPLVASTTTTSVVFVPMAYNMNTNYIPPTLSKEEQEKMRQRMEETNKRMQEEGQKYAATAVSQMSEADRNRYQEMQNKMQTYTPPANSTAYYPQNYTAPANTGGTTSTTSGEYKPAYIAPSYSGTGATSSSGTTTGSTGTYNTYTPPSGTTSTTSGSNYSNGTYTQPTSGTSGTYTQPYSGTGATSSSGTTTGSTGTYTQPTSGTTETSSGTTSTTNTTTTNVVVSLPMVTTGTVSASGETFAGAMADITNTGGTNATVRGFKYGLSQTDTWTASESGSFGMGSFSKQLSGLTAATTYYVRAFATNSAGSGFGEWKSFTTYSGSGGSGSGTSMTWEQARQACMTQLGYSEPITDPAQYSAMDSCTRQKMGMTLNKTCKRLWCKIVPAIKNVFAGRR